MTIKIDAPRERNAMCGGHPTGYRLVRESDWRKIMAVVRAADKERGTNIMGEPCVTKTGAALDNLRKHLEKRK